MYENNKIIRCGKLDFTFFFCAVRLSQTVRSPLFSRIYSRIFLAQILGFHVTSFSKI